MSGRRLAIHAAALLVCFSAGRWLFNRHTLNDLRLLEQQHDSLATQVEAFRHEAAAAHTRDSLIAARAIAAREADLRDAQRAVTTLTIVNDRLRDSVALTLPDTLASIMDTLLAAWDAERAAWQQERAAAARVKVGLEDRIDVLERERAVDLAACQAQVDSALAQFDRLSKIKQPSLLRRAWPWLLAAFTLGVAVK